MPGLVSLCCYAFLKPPEGSICLYNLPARRIDHRCCLHTNLPLLVIRPALLQISDVWDSLCGSMPLGARQVQAISRPLSHDELVQLQRIAAQAGSLLMWVDEDMI